MRCDCPQCVFAAILRTSLLGPGLPTPCSTCGGSGLDTPPAPADAYPAGVVGGPCLECLGLGMIFH